MGRWSQKWSQDPLVVVVGVSIVGVEMSFRSARWRLGCIIKGKELELVYSLKKWKSSGWLLKVLKFHTFEHIHCGSYTFILRRERNKNIIHSTRYEYKRTSNTIFTGKQFSSHMHWHCWNVAIFLFLETRSAKTKKHRCGRSKLAPAPMQSWRQEIV